MEISWGLEIYTKDIWPTVLKVSGPSGQRFKDLDMSQEAVLIAGRERERERVDGGKSRAVGTEGGRGKGISEIK